MTNLERLTSVFLWRGAPKEDPIFRKDYLYMYRYHVLYTLGLKLTFYKTIIIAIDSEEVEMA